MLDRRDLRRLIDTGMVLGIGATVVLTVAGVFGLAIRIFTALAWGGC